MRKTSILFFLMGFAVLAIFYTFFSVDRLQLGPDVNQTVIPGTNTVCTGQCFTCLLNAIRQVESGGQPNEPNAGCNAVVEDPPGSGSLSCGPYQIKEGYCKDAKELCPSSITGHVFSQTKINPCCELKNYDCEDLCKDCNGNAECCEKKKKMSELMMACYFMRYTTKGDCKTGHGPKGKFTCEDLARMHNGGPCGHNKEATKKYWENVKKIMRKTCPECLS